MRISHLTSKLIGITNIQQPAASGATATLPAAAFSSFGQRNYTTNLAIEELEQPRMATLHGHRQYNVSDTHDRISIGRFTY